MAKKSSVIKWIFVLLVICILLPVVFVLLLDILNKRHPQIDYLAEYNRISKPANFDPNDNAAPYFEKAFEVMTKEPNDFESFRRLWPADMNEDQLQMTKQWIKSNSQAIDYLKQAISKSYYWKPLQAKNNEILMAESNRLPRLRKATNLLCLDAKLMAQEGQIEAAFRQLTDAYKMGTFLGGSNIVIDQLVGIGISSFAVNSAFQVLDHTNPAPAILKDFQQRISELSFDKPFQIKFDGERLIFKDEVERRFSGRGGMLEFSKDSGSFWKSLFMSTLGRPWATREIRKADVIYDYLNSAAHKTPWQLHNEGNDIDTVTNNMTKGTLYLHILIPAFSRVLPMSYRAQVCTDALIATTAILRYKSDKGGYPKDLQMLVASDYLDKLPIDPFSDGPLSYKISGDGFILYSFAQDFDDDGGKHDPKWADEGDGDYVFWPVQKTDKVDRTKTRN
jgi:hypothetical protein